MSLRLRLLAIALVATLALTSLWANPLEVRPPLGPGMSLTLSVDRSEPVRARLEEDAALLVLPEVAGELPLTGVTQPELDLLRLETTADEVASRTFMQRHLRGDYALVGTTAAHHDFRLRASVRDTIEARALSRAVEHLEQRVRDSCWEGVELAPRGADQIEVFVPDGVDLHMPACP